MSTTRRRGPPDEPEMSTGRLLLRAPPAAPPAEGASGVLTSAIPLLGGLGSVLLVVTAGAADARSTLAAGLFLLATVAFVVVQLDRQRQQRAGQVAASRTGYLHHLRTCRRVVRDAAEQQRRALTRRHPTPAALPALAAEGSRVWERGPADRAFLHVRYGVRTQPLTLELATDEEASDARADPAAARALDRFLTAHRLQAGLPASFDLRGCARIELGGPKEPVRSLARALICSATAFHSPEHLRVAVLCPPRGPAHWDWVKWLPHCWSDRRSDAVGPLRMVATSYADLAGLLPPGAGERPGVDGPLPHVLLIADGVVAPEGGPGVTVLELAATGDDEADGSGPTIRLDGADVPGLPDRCDPATAEALARRLTRFCTGGAGGAGGPPDLMELLGLGDVRGYDPRVAWRERADRDRLRVPVGVGEDGAPVHLDLKESAQQGMGPHGLVVGATGSGKSELLRTLVLGLALTHSPERLNLVLVDFKGGATFAGLAGLPHVSALITNLSQELALVDRMQDALTGELVRRQELLRAAGNLVSVRDHELARAAGAGLAPMPSLLIVVDEFSELLAARPEFADLFVTIGRLGRSLGLHLLLASQRLEEGRLRGLESHLSYRIGLRTFSAAESRAVLGSPEAHQLPAAPGEGYLRPDPSTLQRFTAAHVSRPTPAALRDRGPDPPGILPFTLRAVDVPEAPGPAPPVPTEPETLLDAAVRRLADHGPGAHRVWLPPLEEPETLDSLLGDLTVDPRLGLVSPRWRGLGRLVVPLGTLDRPRAQRRDPLAADLGGARGHVAVVGGPRSGKSTLLRTIVAGLALTTTPWETQCFVLDLGGGAFAPLAGLPHVSGIGSRAEPDVLRRIVAEVRGVVERREVWFRTHGIDSIETYRARRTPGDADDGWGDVFLVVDGWGTLRADFEELETELQRLGPLALTYGVHLVAGATRWSDFRASVRDLFGTRLELRLGDPVDSEVDRRAAASVPTGRPGRGLAPGALHFLAALPRIDGAGVAETLPDGVDDLVRRVRAGWHGPAAPPLRLLPERLDLATLRARAEPADGDRSLLLGVDERELAPVALDVDAEPHLVVLGDSGSGKTAGLRTYLQEVMRTRSPAESQVVLVDYRHALLGEVPDDYLLHHLTSAARAGPALRDLAGLLDGRLPGPEVTVAQLRGRSWWRGADVFVVVDDYDLVATHLGSPVQALQPLLAQARDVGLHLVVARRSGGAARALYEPVLQSLRELAAPGLLLSGSPDEGPLLGAVRAQPAPPGRGRLVTRGRGTEVVQLAWTDPAG